MENKYITFFLFQLENLVREMQDPEHGGPVRSQKLFFTDIPAAFMGKLNINEQDEVF